MLINFLFLLYLTCVIVLVSLLNRMFTFMLHSVYTTSRATEILKFKSVRSTDDVIDMSSTIINSHENSSFSSKSVSEIDYFSDTVQLEPVVSKRSRDNPKSLA